MEIQRTTALTETAPAGDNIVLFHAAGIKAAWQDAESHWHQSISCIIECGQRLQNAKDEMKGKAGKGRWLQLFDPAIGDLPFKEDKAERLMAIARNKVLTDSAHVRNLPPHWSTLHVLSKATPKQLEKWIADGSVNAEMERKDAEELVGTKKKAKAKKVPAVSDNDADDSGDDSGDDIADDSAAIADDTNEQHTIKYLESLLKMLGDAAAVDWEKLFSKRAGLIRDVRDELTYKIEAHEKALARNEEFEGRKKLN